MVDIQDENKPSILLIGQSRAGKSKFISEFLHEKIKVFLPVRAHGQTTKFISFYKLVPNDIEVLRYEVIFAEEDDIKEKFYNILDKAVQVSKEKDEEISLENFKKQLTENKDKLFDIQKLAELSELGLEFIDKLFYSYKENDFNSALNYMMDELYLKVISKHLKDNEICLVNEINLNDFNKDHKRFLDSIEPLIKMLNFYIPVSSKYDKYLFNQKNNGLIFVDTVGTDHTGTDKIDSIFGLYNYKYNLKPDVVTFINDFNDFREKTEAIKNIFDKIISDNSLSRFVLVNTKLDLRLGNIDAFQDLKEEYYEATNDKSEKLVKDFQKNEENLVEEIYSQISDGLEVAVDEYLKSKGMQDIDKKAIVEKIKDRCRVNSIFISNPETDRRYNQRMDVNEFELYNQISKHNLNAEIIKYIKIVFDNYRRIKENNIIYIRKKDINQSLIKISDLQKLKEEVEEILNKFCDNYRKLRFPYYNSMRALSNGFNRKHFVAASSSYYKCFPNAVLIDIIIDWIKENDKEILSKNYEIDFTRISRDEYIFENNDPIISDKLLKNISYYDFNALVWNKIVEYLIDANQFNFTKKIDNNWYSANLESELERFYNQEDRNKYINAFEVEYDRWDFMGNVIGYQIEYAVNKNKESLNQLIMDFISTQIKNITNLVGKEIIFYDEDLEEEIERKFKEIKYSNKKFLLCTEGKTDVIHIETAWKKLKNTELPFEMCSINGADKLKDFLLVYPPEKFKQVVIGLFDYDEKGLQVVKKLGASFKTEISQYTKKYYVKDDHRSCYAIILPHRDEKFRLFENCPIEFLYKKELLEEYKFIKKRNIHKINSIEYVKDSGYINKDSYENLEDLYFFDLDETTYTKYAFAQSIKERDDLTKVDFEGFKLLFDEIEHVINLCENENIVNE